MAHEALIRGWGQLRQWVDADRAGLRTRRRLTETAREWEQHDRDPDLLFTGARLATAREWSESHPGELSPSEVDFLAAAISAERKKKDDEVERARRHAEAEAAACPRGQSSGTKERARNQCRIIAGLSRRARRCGLARVACRSRAEPRADTRPGRRGDGDREGQNRHGRRGTTRRSRPNTPTPSGSPHRRPFARATTSISPSC